MSAQHNDEERLARWHLRKDQQDRLVERFKDRDDPLAILVVCDMLLTGFDAPVEQVMYLDTPLKEHSLLQAIARVNRPHGDEKDYGLVEKVRQLIADAVAADGIQILVKEVPLFSPEFEEKMESLATNEAKASEMEHAIRREISIRVEENPAFYESLRERLEAIIEERRQERIDAAEQLSLLFTLREEAQGEQNQAQDMGLDARGHAIYGLLEKGRTSKLWVACARSAEGRVPGALPAIGTARHQQNGNAPLEKQRPSEIAEQTGAPYGAANRELAATLDRAIDPFTEVVDWWQKEDLQRQMRKTIKQHLRARGLADDDLEGLAAGIVDLAKTRRRRDAR